MGFLNTLRTVTGFSKVRKITLPFLVFEKQAACFVPGIYELAESLAEAGEGGNLAGCWFASECFDDFRAIKKDNSNFYKILKKYTTLKEKLGAFPDQQRSLEIQWNYFRRLALEYTQFWIWCRYMALADKEHPEQSTIFIADYQAYKRVLAREQAAVTGPEKIQSIFEPEFCFKGPPPLRPGVFPDVQSATTAVETFVKRLRAKTLPPEAILPFPPRKLKCFGRSWVKDERSEQEQEATPLFSIQDHEPELRRKDYHFYKMEKILPFFAFISHAIFTVGATFLILDAISEFITLFSVPVWGLFLTAVAVFTFVLFGNYLDWTRRAEESSYGVARRLSGGIFDAQGFKYQKKNRWSVLKTGLTILLYALLGFNLVLFALGGALDLRSFFENIGGMPDIHPIALLSFMVVFALLTINSVMPQFIQIDDLSRWTASEDNDPFHRITQEECCHWKDYKDFARAEEEKKRSLEAQEEDERILEMQGPVPVVRPRVDQQGPYPAAPLSVGGGSVPALLPAFEGMISPLDDGRAEGNLGEDIALTTRPVVTI